MLDQFRQIAIFSKTIDHGSFRGAARELRLSPSVVSHHISQLEETLGVALLYRSTRKLALTKEGERLLVAARQMTEAIDAGLSDLANAKSQQTGELRLTVPSVLAQSRLTGALGIFATNHPGLKLTLNFTDTREEIIESGLDVAIRMTRGYTRSANSKRLFTVERRLVASKNYLATRPKPFTPGDIVDWDWLGLAPVQHIKTSFTKKGSKPISFKTNAQVVANDARALYHLACSGAGLAIVPSNLTEDHKKDEVDFVLPDWKLEPVDVFAIWPSNAPRHGLIRLLIDWLSQELAKSPQG